MTSRILQENTDLLLTQSNDPLINDNFIGSDGFSTGNPQLATTTLAQTHTLTSVAIVTQDPVVSSTAIAQEHSLTALGFNTGSPVANQAVLTQNHSLVPIGFSTGTPEANQTTLAQEHSLTASAILTGSPVVANATMVEGENFAPPSFITGTPSVGSPTLTQNYSLTANSILTGIPDIEDAVDPTEAILAQEIQEIEQMFGGWQRRTYEVPDGRLVQGEREIQATYGDYVSIDRKAKSLIKFGKSASLSTNTLETVWSVGGNENYISTNDISFISSSSASDTQQITIEGHTISNGEFTFVVQTATLNGQNAVGLATDLARVSRIYNSDSTELVGRVVVYENATLSGGIPTDATKIHIDIPAGFQQSFKAATTFSNTDYFIMTGFYGAVSAKVSAGVDFFVEIRESGKVFLPKGSFTASSSGGASDISLDPAIIVPKNADIRIRAETVTNNAIVFGIFKGYLAKVL
tara:strand:- start:302 stop:1696 length:1395 start_codon:yes stop_codon:yes gene_type:complete